METLQDKIKKSEKHNADVMADIATKREDLEIMYKKVFKTPEGQEVLNEMINSYLVPTVTPKMTQNEIMFIEGQNSVVKRILTLIQEKGK